MKQSNARVSFMPGGVQAGDIPPTGQINWHSVPPTPIVVQGPATKPAPRFPWALLIVVAGICWCVSNLSKTAQERPQAQVVQTPRPVAQTQPTAHVERAQAVVVPRAELYVPPRAEAVGNHEQVDQAWIDNPANIGKWVAMRIPDEGSVWVRYQGSILEGMLPAKAKRWDWYRMGQHDWVYMAPAGTSHLGWVDP